jgi:hypothetical protein
VTKVQRIGGALWIHAKETEDAIEPRISVYEFITAQDVDV